MDLTDPDMYVKHWGDFVDKEKAHARELFDSRIAGKSTDQLRREGLCALGLVAGYVESEERRVELVMRGGREIPQALRSEPMIAITLGDLGPLDSQKACFIGALAVGSGQRADRIEIEIHKCRSPPTLTEECFGYKQELEDYLDVFKTKKHKWRVDIWFADLPFVRMRKALAKFQTDDNAERLRNTLLGVPLEDSPVESYSKILTESILDKGKLNPSQKDAVRQSLSKAASLVQGPPGTGKTRTACEVLRGAVFLTPRRNTRAFLAVACSNEAADNILRGMTEQKDIKVVRVGRSADESLFNYSLTVQARKRPRYKDAMKHLYEAIEKKQEAHDKLGFSGSDLQPYFLIVSEARRKLRKAFNAAVREVLVASDGVVTTCVGAGDQALDNLRFELVLLDEASQATEPLAMIPLVRGFQSALPTYEGVDSNDRILVDTTAAEERFTAFASTVLAKSQDKELSVGVDCEWGRDPEQPISLLQLAIQFESKTVVYLIDMERPVGENTIFVCRRLLQGRHRVVVFAGDGDVKRLSQRGVLHIPQGSETSGADRFRPENVGWIDYQQQQDWAHGPPGLAKIVARVLGKSMDKSMQVSDWNHRPFSNEQLEYAARDASVLLELPRRFKHRPEPQAPAGHFVLIGDQKQLRPVVLCEEAQKGPQSLFERLADEGFPQTMLDVQYRMHPKIAEFISGEFYGGRLQSGCSGQDRVAPGGGAPMIFVEVPEASERQGLYGRSFYSNVEAELIKERLRSLLDAGNVTEEDIGVISPYAGQVELVRQDIVKEFPDVEVKSVDGFQGREKDIILLSTVRSKKRLGFLTDWRRLNVAVSRARRQVIIFGKRNTLAEDKHWASLLSRIGVQESPAAPKKSKTTKTTKLSKAAKLRKKKAKQLKKLAAAASQQEKTASQQDARGLPVLGLLEVELQNDSDEQDPEEPRKKKKAKKKKKKAASQKAASGLSVSTPKQGFPRGIKWAGNPIVLKQVHGAVEEPGPGYLSASFQNKKEAGVLKSMLAHLIRNGDVSSSQVGVFSPYAAQVNLLRSLLEEDFPEVDVEVTPAFTKDLIMLSTVRAAPVKKRQQLIKSAVSSSRRGLLVVLCSNEAQWLKHLPQTAAR